MHPCCADELFTANDHTKRDPVSWEVLGKSVCGYWMSLVEVTDFAPPYGRHASYGNFTVDTAQLAEARWCDNSTTYRITISDVRGQDGLYDGAALSEIVFYGPDGEVLPIASITMEPMGVVAHPNQWTDKLFDGSTSNKWIDSGFVPGSMNSTLVVTLARPALLTSYEFITAPDVPRRDPTAWTLERMDGFGVYQPLAQVSNMVPDHAREGSYGMMYAIAPPPSPSLPHPPSPPMPPMTPPAMPPALPSIG